jgi:hypothetical protein
MPAMSEQAILAAVVLALPALMLLAVLAVARRDRFQFSLRMIMLWLIPLAAIIAWIVSWDGPFVSSRRVFTHKTAMLAVVLNATVFIAMWHRGWFRFRAMLWLLLLWAILFGWLAWSRHQQIKRDQSSPANSARPL